MPGACTRLWEPGSRHGVTGIPALGTSSTQSDGGVNDSFGHLRPSGDSGGGGSAGMTCVMARSTDKGEMERDKVKRATGHARTPRETRMRQNGYRPPEVSAFSLQVWACRERPRPATDFISQPPHIHRRLVTRAERGEKQCVSLLAGASQKHIGDSPRSLQRILQPQRRPGPPTQELGNPHYLLTSDTTLTRPWREQIGVVLPGTERG